jgi:ribonuclease BN (tRNA processing enzyme)
VVSADELTVTVLGCSGSYGAPRGGACSGYLVRAGDTTIWMDCGNGTLVNLQRHADIADIDALVITHLHPDHCADIYGLHVLNRYGLQREGLPVFAPSGVEAALAPLVAHDWGATFEWCDVEDGDTATIGAAKLAFSRTDHPVPTNAVQLAFDGRRLVYTSDTGPGWTPDAFERGADLLISDSSYLHDTRPTPIHLSAREAGAAARASGAQRLVLTHLWPMVDADKARAEGSEAFGAPVHIAQVHETYTVESATLGTTEARESDEPWHRG